MVGQLSGIISVVAFSFMVQDPRGIIELVRDKSLFSNCLMYRSILVSDWWVLKVACSRKVVFRFNVFGILDSG